MDNKLLNQQILDPFDRDIRADSEEILTANQGLESTILRYQSNPWLAKGIFLLIIFLDLILFVYFAITSARAGMAAEIITEIAFLPLLPCAYYYGILCPTQADYMRLLLARSFGWLYRSGSELVDKEMYVSPEIIFREGVPETLSSQFWGFLSYGNQMVPFWLGEMINERAKDDVKRQHAILFLPKVVACALSVVSRTNPFDKFDETVVRTESIEFNKYFYIEPAAPATGQVVFQMMTPPVLDAIVSLRRVAGMFRLTFCNGRAIFIFATPFFAPKYSNLLRSATIDQRDINLLQEKKEKLSELLRLIATQTN